MELKWISGLKFRFMLLSELKMEGHFLDETTIHTSWEKERRTN